MKLKMRFFQHRYVLNEKEQFEMKKWAAISDCSFTCFYLTAARIGILTKHKQPDSWGSTPDFTYKINKLSSFS